VAGIALILGLTIGLGYLLARRTRIPAAFAWLLVVAMVASVDAIAAHERPFLRMWVLIAALLYSMKSVVAREHARRTGRPLTGREWYAFTLAWPGMDPAPFTRRASGTGDEAAALLRRGLWALVGGIVLVALATIVMTRSRLAATVLALPGFSLMLHFGLFPLLTAFWRRRGIDVDVSFDAPWHARSLADFWGGRWNPAFTQMTAAIVYRPLARRAGIHAALAASFALSGVLHEVAVSLPVRAGFGGPFAYFALHGALVMLERSALSSALRAHPMLARVWTALWLLVPLPLLFHRPFLAGVVWPLLSR
jgi:hypothetical protein